MPSLQPDTAMEKSLDRITASAVALLVAAMVAVILASVFTRYLLNDPIGWAEQVAKYLMIWAAFLGASLGIKEGSHIAVNILVDVLPGWLQKVCGVVGLLMTAGFLLITAYQGVLFTIKVSSHTDPLVWEMSLAWAYAAIPVGAILMLLQLAILVRKTGLGQKMSTVTTMT
jgi:TRAP-type C4-dicarboxylate transport system permease small subunit